MNTYKNNERPFFWKR